MDKVGCEFCTTDDFTEKDIFSFCALFDSAFHKTFAPAYFKVKYGGSCYGHSYHVLVRDVEHNIVAAYNVIPLEFMLGERRCVFGLSVDTMVHPNHRKDIMCLAKMAKAMEIKLQEKGIPFIFGFPNDNAIDYLKKVVRWKEIGELDYYVLPLAPSMFFSLPKWIDSIWKALLRVGLMMPRNWWPSRVVSPLIRRIRSSEPEWYVLAPMRRIDRVGEGNWRVTAEAREENGFLISYLVDVCPSSGNALSKALRGLLKSQSRADLIAFIGVIPFRPGWMVRMPKNQIPKRFRLLGKMVIDDPMASSIWELSNWEINLATFDVR